MSSFEGSTLVNVGSRRQRSPSPETMSVDTKSPASKPLNEKGRVDGGDTLTAAFAKPPLTGVSGLRTALDLQAALREATGFSIGSCRTKIRALRHTAERYGGSEVEYDSDEESKPELLINHNLLEGLAPLYKRFSTTKRCGRLGPIKLRITRAGCAFDGQITHDESRSETNARLSQWFEHASVSGYGDVLAQETKFNEDVRNAREIPAFEFFVEEDLLESIKSCWAQSFHPSNVRVEPYKIHLYGPGGHFRPHRDTPSTNLVGTFLLGLGDSTYGRYLNVDGMKLSAEGGTWCAFFPDVVHSVERIPQGYRAVIAFKIFRAVDDPRSLCNIPDEYRSQVDKVFDQLKLPIGIFLDRKYCMGTTELSGLDAYLVQCAESRAQNGDFAVHVLPVVTKGWAQWWTDGTEGEDSFSASVFPFTDAHVDGALGRDDGEKQKRRDVFKNVRDVPFYGIDWESSTIIWREELDEAVNTVGNEAEAYKEDSVYFSYALLILPSSGTAGEGRQSN
ncbi:hypothetical protein JAAARDRAFT_59585 [Jaapia argillacea MUCL 33604]|uniref:Fe2OG dioxygenase domain-containing protein n=1 Tax=Jaapia argillacea MUCL 33604 TaxID=933084 RepID=A0A067PWA9_9AGAM|nr:hypothetical protein JAAARDRAFT_59585 [Jaapia argillacea MUCL 33604]